VQRTSYYAAHQIDMDGGQRLSRQVHPHEIELVPVVHALIAIITKLILLQVVVVFRRLVVEHPMRVDIDDDRVVLLRQRGRVPGRSLTPVSRGAGGPKVEDRGGASRLGSLGTRVIAANGIRLRTGPLNTEALDLRGRRTVNEGGGR